MNGSVDLKLGFLSSVRGVKVASSDWEWGDLPELPPTTEYSWEEEEHWYWVYCNDTYEKWVQPARRTRHNKTGWIDTEGIDLSCVRAWLRIPNPPPIPDNIGGVN